MKKKLFLMMIAAAVITGCNKNDDNTDPDNGGNGSADSGLSIDKTTIDAAAAAGTYQLQVTATQAWSAAVNAGATWCTLSPDNYAGNRAVTVNVTENPTVGTQRAATITFTSSTLTRAVGVTQAAIAPVLTADPTAIDAVAGAASYSIAVTSNTTWTATVNTGATWCTLAGTPGNGDGTVTVNVALNAATVTRSATVTLAAGTLTRAVAITQEKAPFPTGTGGPNTAHSTTTWMIGAGNSAQMWSDRIVATPSNCTQTTSLTTSNYTTAEYRVYEGRNYYSWSCVNVAQTTLCPSPWRVPSQSDFSTLVSNLGGNTQSARDKIIAAWGYGGRADGSSMSRVSTHAYYWSSEVYLDYIVYDLVIEIGEMEVGDQLAYYGFQVRCVQ